NSKKHSHARPARSGRGLKVLEMIQSSSDGSDAAARARTERLLQGASDAAALRHRLALIDAEAQHRLAQYRSHYNPDSLASPRAIRTAGNGRVRATRESEYALLEGTRRASVPQVSLELRWSWRYSQSRRIVRRRICGICLTKRRVSSRTLSSTERIFSGSTPN